MIHALAMALYATVAVGMTAVLPLVTVTLNEETSVSSSVMTKGMDKGDWASWPKCPLPN